MIFLLVSMLVGILIGVPIAIALGFAATATVVVVTDIPLSVVGFRFVGGLEAPTLMAIPFFILAGVLMEAGGIARRLVAFSQALVGWITGSLLLVTTVSATGLAAVCGSGSADAAAVSSILGPNLKRGGYNMDFAAALIAASATLAQIIPPSIMLILVAVAANLSTGAMLLSGIIPGIGLMAAFLVAAYLHAKTHGEGVPTPDQRFGFKVLLWTTLDAWAAWGMMLIVVGGILSGAVTSTEAAALAAAYALLVGAVFYRELKWTDFVRCLVRTVALSAAILMIIGSVSVLNWVVSTLGLQAALNGILIDVAGTRVQFLFASMVILLVLGMFVESFALILLLTPVLMPIAIEYGIEPHHYALLIVFNLCIGMITPPFAATVFVTSTVLNREVLQVSKKIILPWISMIAVLALTMAFPEMALYLPRLAGFIQ